MNSKKLTATLTDQKQQQKLRRDIINRMPQEVDKNNQAENADIFFNCGAIKGS